MPRNETTMTAYRPERQLRQRCRLLTALLCLSLLLVTLTLWITTWRNLNQQLRTASRDISLQAADQMLKYYEDRITALRLTSRIYGRRPDKSQSTFSDLAGSILIDVPGIEAVLSADKDGLPIWVEPGTRLNRGEATRITGNPAYHEALEKCQRTGQPVMSRVFTIPRSGEGFVVLCPSMRGQVLEGFVVGLFDYKNLQRQLLQLETRKPQRLSVKHAETMVTRVRNPLDTGSEQGQFDALSHLQDAQDFLDNGYEVLRRKMLADCSISLVVAPINPNQTSILNFLPMTILCMGLALTGLLTFLGSRWLWRNASLQTEARDNRQRLEKADTSLIEIQNELELVLNGVEEGVILYDMDRSPIQANSAFLSIFHLTDGGVTMQDPDQHHQRMERYFSNPQQYGRLFEQLRRQPEVQYQDEIEAIGSGQDKRPHKIFQRRGFNVVGADGAPSGLLLIYRDITNTQEIDRIRNEFLSNVTHELRSPLASIRGFAETLRRNPDMELENREEFISIICDESERLQHLIEDVLRLRQMEQDGSPLVRSRFELKAVVEQTLRATNTVLRLKNIKVRQEWSGLSDSHVDGDLSQLQLAVRNLITNAVKYSPEGSVINITGHVSEDHIRMEIQDKGTGIADKDLPYIFDKFYRGTSKGRQRGSGLGLAMVYHIIQRHGGFMGVKSEIGSGTAFSFELPRAGTHAPTGS